MYITNKTGIFLWKFVYGGFESPNLIQQYDHWMINSDLKTGVMMPVIG